MKPLPLHEKRTLLNWIEETFGIPTERLEPFFLFKRGRDVWMASPQLEVVLKGTEERPGTGNRGSPTFRHPSPAPCPLPITRAGLRLARQDRQSYRLTTPAVQFLGRWATKRVIDITPQEGERYIRGEDLPLTSTLPIPRGQVIVRVQGRPLGSGLLEGERIKNQIPVAQRVRKAL